MAEKKKTNREKESLDSLKDVIDTMVHENLRRAFGAGKRGAGPLSFEDRLRDLLVFGHLRDLAFSAGSREKEGHALEFIKWLLVDRVYCHRPSPKRAKDWAYAECSDKIVGISDDWTMYIEREFVPHHPVEFIRFNVRRG